MHLEKSYRLGLLYYDNMDNYRVFQNHEYFRDIRQKPNEHNIMRSVLKFTMQAKGNQQRLFRLYKRAPVLEQFYAEGVIPDHVAALLKERGGVDFIYDQLCASKKIRREVFAVEDEGHAPDAPNIEVLHVETIENLSSDETSDAAELQADDTLAGNSIVLKVNPPSDNRVSRPAPPLPRAEFGQPDEVKGTRHACSAKRRSVESDQSGD
jgi:hypothetical protein